MDCVSCCGIPGAFGGQQQTNKQTNNDHDDHGDPGIPSTCRTTMVRFGANPPAADTPEGGVEHDNDGSTATVDDDVVAPEGDPDTQSDTAPEGATNDDGPAAPEGAETGSQPSWEREVTTRSGRGKKPPAKLREQHPSALSANLKIREPPVNYKSTKTKVSVSKLNQQFLMSLKWNEIVDNLRSGKGNGGGSDLRAMLNLMEQNTDLDENMVDWMHPMTLAAQANSADNPTWEEAMNGPNAAEYLKAPQKEIETLTKDKDAWETVTKEDWMNVLPSTWTFKCKQYPDGRICKFKGCFCAHGDRQVENVDYFEMFAPVVNWTTVRLLLILSIILNLATKQVDYTAAFVHAPIDKHPEWDTMSQEERDRSGVYVQKNASRVWTTRKGIKTQQVFVRFKTIAA